MAIKLSFFGAARNVTGSCYLLEADGTRVMVDCGLYQERELRERNWLDFPVAPNTIDAVLLTHAHLDHCGLLPKLVRDGFAGRIYCPGATAEIARIVMTDSAHLQEEDAKYKQKRHRREGRTGPHPEVPLYSIDDVQNTLSLFSAVPYEQSCRITDGIDATFHDAGHILGSSMIKVNVGVNGQGRSILFSGDVGRWDKPILRDPSLIDAADYVLVESTYGDRIHDEPNDTDQLMCDVINRTRKAGGNIVIPSFALERSQEVLYNLNSLLIAGRIPPLTVFFDSPMAINVTQVFRDHPELFDAEMTNLVNNDGSPFAFPGLTMTRSTDQSKAINEIRGTAIIIAGSGMCTGGRVKHHLVNNISRPESTILFVGYQAVGTLGRHIVEGKDPVRILGQMHSVSASIERIHGFSGHADRNELFRWLSGLKTVPRHVFVTHGEPDAANAFSEFVSEKTGWETSVPRFKDEVVLN